jgi:hypothetical protein
MPLEHHQSLHMVTALLFALGFQGEPPRGASLPRQAVADSVRRFPRVEGTNLEGHQFTLPADFEGKYNVVLIAFQREQQQDVDGWLPFLRQLATPERQVRVYELPTLSRKYRLIRRFIDGGMARGIPERATREATITLYIDKAPFKNALAIASEDSICTLLVARDGRVLWRAHGPFTPSAAAELRAALDSAEAQHASP